MLKFFLNIFGLICGFIASVLLYFFGIPRYIGINGQVQRSFRDWETDASIKRTKRDSLVSDIALLLLSFGFLLQLIGSFI
jgi:hypothetical protein